MKILMITTNDPAGTAFKFADALNRTTRHRCRVISTESSRYGHDWAKDVHLPDLKEPEVIPHLLQEADVFHFHMTADESLPLGSYCAAEFLKGHPAVHHHHGEPAFRADPRRFADRELSQGRRAIVSTPDLWAMYPEAEWIPNCVPHQRRASGSGRWVVGHSPSRRDLKNTAEFLEVMEQVDAEMRLIENVSNEECVRLKAGCDLFFDHMQGYYGVSSLEAMAQGIPTIAGIDDWNAWCIRRFTGQDRLPWIMARNRQELGDAIRRRDLEETGRYAYEWMEREWSEERIVARLAEFYETL